MKKIKSFDSKRRRILLDFFDARGKTWKETYINSEGIEFEHTLESLRQRINAVAVETYGLLDPISTEVQPVIDQEVLRNKYILVKETIADLEKVFGKTIDVKEVYCMLQSKGMEEVEAKDFIARLKRAGDFF